MNVYYLVVALHVVSLSFCAGPVLALAVVPGELSPSAAQRLSRVASFGLLGLLLTGGAAVAMTGPAFVHTWWLRLSGAALPGHRRPDRVAAEIDPGARLSEQGTDAGLGHHRRPGPGGVPHGGQALLSRGDGRPSPARRGRRAS